jgi:hypothetical protein
VPYAAPILQKTRAATIPKNPNRVYIFGS